MNQPVKTNVPLADLLPNDWFDNEGETRVLQVAYTCNFFRPADINQPYLTGQIDDVCYVVFDLAEGMEFLSIENVIKVIDKIPQVHVKVDKATTQAATHIMFFALYREDGETTEAEALGKIESARGLVSAVEGLNSNYEHVFTRELNLPSGQESAPGPVVKVPHTYPVPFVHGDRVNSIASSLEELDDPLRRRILLGLRWFDKADREIDSLDAFLKSWFALEVVAMPDTTNIRPMVESLASIYGMPYRDAVAHFQIGRIQNLRADIVHNGAVRPIHYMLHNYIQAVFVDILFFLASQVSERRAEAVLQDTTFDQATWRP
ncbi:MAG: hypothetical protein JJ911_16915 [Rhizobiaceae bacterium]|nr:hypothetical protein [Rhizobiaceae bacterium]